MSVLHYVLLALSLTVVSCQRPPQFQFQPPSGQSQGNDRPSAAPQSERPQSAPARPARPQVSVPVSPQSVSNAAQVLAVRVDYNCPERFGFFPHHKSCDKYYSCENGTATLKVCGNGLVFDDADSTRENCGYPFSVDCGERTDLVAKCEKYS